MIGRVGCRATTKMYTWHRPKMTVMWTIFVRHLIGRSWWLTRRSVSQSDVGLGSEILLVCADLLDTRTFTVVCQIVKAGDQEGFQVWKKIWRFLNSWLLVLCSYVSFSCARSEPLRLIVDLFFLFILYYDIYWDILFYMVVVNCDQT